MFLGLDCSLGLDRLVELGRIRVMFLRLPLGRQFSNLVQFWSIGGRGILRDEGLGGGSSGGSVGLSGLGVPGSSGFGLSGLGSFGDGSSGFPPGGFSPGSFTRRVFIRRIFAGW